MERIKRRLASNPKLRALFIILAWGTLNVAATMAGILDGALVPQRLSGGGGLVIPTLSSPVLQMPLNLRVSEFHFELQTGQILGVQVGMLLFYLEILGIAILAGLLLEELERVLVSFLVCYVLTVFLVYFILILPGLAGRFDLSALQGIGILFVFSIFFPIPIFLGGVGCFIGAAVSERWR